MTDRFDPLPPEKVHHNHFTRDIKPHRECPACDVIHRRVEHDRQWDLS